MYTIKLPLIFQPFTCNHLVRLGKDFDGGYLVDEYSIKDSNLLSSNDHLIFDQQIILPHKLDMPNNINDQEFCITF